MSLRKAVSLGSLQTAVSLAVGFLSVKITSVYLGPAGVGVLGQMQQFIHLAFGVVVTGLKNGVVRRTAELGHDADTRAVVVATVLKLLLVMGLPVAAAVLIGSEWLASELLNNKNLRVALVLFSGAYVFGLVGTLILGCANGARDYRSTTTINIAASVSNLLLFAVLCPLYGLLGALISVAIMPLLSLCVGAVVARRAAWWPRRAWSAPFSTAEATRAFGFVPAAAIGAVAAPLMHIVLREGLANHSGAAAVGLVQGIVRLSDMYMGIVVSVFSMYFLPRFAQIKRVAELGRELRLALLMIVPGLMTIGFALYLMRDMLIVLLFTREFTGMRDLFAWQMVGNVFRMIGWLFGYVMMAKAHPLATAAYEALAIILWWRLGVWLIAEDGAIGATQAYALTYAIYSVMGVVATLWIMRNMHKEE